MSSWRVVTSSGAILMVAGVVLWGVTQVPISLAQNSFPGYGGVGAASTGSGVGAASTGSGTTPITGAGLVVPAIVLLVGMIVFGVGLYLRRSASPTAS
jgi:hypothetical protein